MIVSARKIGKPSQTPFLWFPSKMQEAENYSSENAKAKDLLLFSKGGDRKPILLLKMPLIFESRVCQMTR